MVMVSEFEELEVHFVIYQSSRLEAVLGVGKFPDKTMGWGVVEME